jgi:hypothetical protein
MRILLRNIFIFIFVYMCVENDLAITLMALLFVDYTTKKFNINKNIRDDLTFSIILLSISYNFTINFYYPIYYVVSLIIIRSSLFIEFNKIFFYIPFFKNLSINYRYSLKLMSIMYINIFIVLIFGLCEYSSMSVSNDCLSSLG